MSVTIGISYYDSLTPEMVRSLLSAELPPAVRYAMAGGSLIHQNREAIVTDALAAGSERLLFIDTDVAFLPDAVTRLLAHEYPIVGGAYNLKRLPQESAVKLAGHAGEFFTGQMAVPSHPVEVALLPAGFLSLHLPTLVSRLDRPWFRGDADGQAGEDATFCRAAVAAGFTLWCDFTIPLKHLGRYAY